MGAGQFRPDAAGEVVMNQSFRVATFNAENLLHPGVRFAGRSDAPYGEKLYEEKIAWMRGILREGSVDMVGFQELFSEVALKRAAEGYEHVVALDLEGGKNIVVAPDGRSEAKGPYVGFASRFPVVAQRAIDAFPAEAANLQIEATEGGPLVTLPLTRFQRPVLEVKVLLRSDVTATIYVAHLKSKRSQLLPGEDPKNPLHVARGNVRSLIVRAAESIALRKLVVEATENNDTPVIVLGDLNDDLPSVTTQTVAGEQPFRFWKQPQKVPVWDRLLYSVHDIQEAQSYRDVSYSHIYDGRYELLDHIFVSQEFYAQNPKRLGTVVNTRIFNDHLVDERLAAVVPQGLSNRSDHGIPVTEIEWRPAT